MRAVRLVLLRLAGGLAAAGASACLWAGLWAGGRVLPAPPLLVPPHLGGWWESLGPVGATFAIGRVSLLVLTTGWAAVAAARTAVGMLLYTGRSAPAWLRPLVVWSLERPWRRVVLGALGLSASAGALAACGSTSSGGGVPAPVLVGPVGAVEQPPAVAAPPREAAAPALPAEPRPRQPAAPSRPVAVGAWTVRAGDDFWSIAEAVVARSAPGGADPGGADRVGRYWAALLAANRDRLPVPGDPNLLFPGDVILLPPVGGIGAPDG